MSDAISRLRERDKEIRLLEHTAAILSWDQETYMPEQAIGERAEQLALLQSIAHSKATDEDFGQLMSDVGASEDHPAGSPDLSEDDSAFVRALYHEYRRSVKLPNDLVRRFAAKTSAAQAIWAKARKNNDFASFAPHLREIVDLTLEMAHLIGYEEHPYDALLDGYEPWMKASEVGRIFDGLREELVPLVRRIGEAPQIDDSFLLRRFPVADQEEFGRYVLSELGYDLSRGRLDVSAHPFTTTLGFDDVRLTTRYNDQYFKTALFGTVHECGHGQYELGFDHKYRGSILASGTSLGIHESQSRFWENVVGRSRAFWKRYLPPLKKRFPDQLTDVSVEQFYRAVNKVEPSLIRVEADEVTYSLHIILRFELELALTAGELAVDDLPDAWRQKSRELLGIVPEADAHGVLQDIHWAMGGIGYFPTYSLGNLYAAQFAEAMGDDLGDLDEIVSAGQFSLILGWLREKIHSHGRARTASELCASVTGSELNPQYFTRYLRSKYEQVYGLS